MTGRSETQIREDLDALTRAMGRGISSYSYDGRTITYRSYEEMQKARASLEAELGEAGSTETRQPRHFSDFSKGYE